MSIVVRYNPPSLTTEQYDQADRLLREAGVEPLPEGLEYHVCFGSEGNFARQRDLGLSGAVRGVRQTVERDAGVGRHSVRFWRLSRDLRGTQGPKAVGETPAKGRRRQPGYTDLCAVAVAQLVEPRVVVPEVAGSSPVGHP
jgi:hypothetical protein